MAIVIGMTGNIACGKSTVAAMLRELGAETIDADKVAHQVMARYTPVWTRIIKEFGADILKSDGEIDRAVLGQRVFNDPAALARLEAITYPSVLKKVKSAVARSKASVVVIEMIKLFETGMDKMCDSVWVVACSREQQLLRLMRDRGLTREEAETRIDAQPPLSEKTKRADVIIVTTGTVEQTRAQVMASWQALMRREAGGNGSVPQARIDQEHQSRLRD